MDPTPLDQIARWCGGTLRQGDATTPAENICTDSRQLQAGDLFVALSGENFDGHRFIEEAARRGAIGVVATQIPAGLPSDFAVIEVPDTLLALQGMAGGYRKSLPLQVVCITGSNGKTSTKDLAACVLGERFAVCKTEGNFNNHIGLPLTLLRARRSDEIGVWEIGMNHPGEIAPLAALAAPDVAIVTNIGMAHIEHMGSKEAIAQEKGMLVEALKPEGYVVLSAGDEFSERLAARTKADAVYAGIEKGDVQARDLQSHFNGVRFTIHSEGQSAEAELPVPGLHMVQNAMLAVAVGRIFGLSLEDCAAGLRTGRLTKGRLEQKIIRGVHVLDDTYNANPDSVNAALRTLSQMPAAGRRIAVLGRMGELGAEAERGHRSVGQVAAGEGIDCLIAVGEEARWISEAAYQGGLEKVVHCLEIDEAVRALREMVRVGDVVLVKGSRSARMERIVEGLQTL